MPRCQWCNSYARDIHRIDNGRSILLLCDLCAAQQQVLEQGEIRVDDLVHPPGFWDRVKRLFRGK